MSHGSGRRKTRPWWRAAGLASLLAVLAVAAPARADRDAPLPRPDLLATAVSAYEALDRDGRVANPVLTVIDYAIPSSSRRLWVLDPATRKVLFHEFVAHGRGSSDDSDPNRLVRFGNEPRSLRSSRGIFLTGGTYTGKHGHSLELVGLEPGVNDRALERRIVIHPAHYASASYRAQSGGRLGRSWGCPALDPAIAQQVIDRIAGGGVLYIDGAMSASDLRRAGLDAKP